VQGAGVGGAVRGSVGWGDIPIYRNPVNGDRYVWVRWLQRIEVYRKGKRTPELEYRHINYTGPDKNAPEVWRGVCDLMAGRYSGESFPTL
jgi:hypothetical protein